MAVVAVTSLFALGPALVNQQVLVYVRIHVWTSRRPPLLTLEEQNTNNTHFYQFKYRAINLIELTSSTYSVFFIIPFHLISQSF